MKGKFKRWLFGESHLHTAAEEGNLEAVKELLDNGADIEKKDRDGSTPLMLASYYGNIDIVELLLSKGANCNSKNIKLNKTALHGAVERENFEIVKLLIDHGAQVNVRGMSNFTPLHVITTYFECNENEDIPDWNRLWNMNIWNKKRTNIFKLLLNHGADVNAKGKDGWTPLHLAVRSPWSSIEIVKLLLEKGSDIHAKATYSPDYSPGGFSPGKITSGFTPIILAAQSGRKEIVELLLDYGANVNDKSDDGSTPLHGACASIVMAIKDGAIESHEDVDGIPDEKEVVEFLISKGANVNASHLYGETPLHLAAEFGNLGIVELLLKHGANTLAEDQNHLTALGRAEKQKHKEIVKILREREHIEPTKKIYIIATILSFIACFFGGAILSSFLIDIFNIPRKGSMIAPLIVLGSLAFSFSIWFYIIRIKIDPKLKKKEINR